MPWLVIVRGNRIREKVNRKNKQQLAGASVPSTGLGNCMRGFLIGGIM